MEIDPLTVFTADEYKRWSLDVRSDQITQTIDGQSAKYEGWKEFSLDICASQCFGWRASLANLVKER